MWISHKIFFLKEILLNSEVFRYGISYVAVYTLLLFKCISTLPFANMYILYAFNCVVCYNNIISVDYGQPAIQFACSRAWLSYQ